LRAAREVFSEVGYEAATFQEIAARADLTRPAINHYYANKQDLYRQVVEETNGVVIAAGLREAEAEDAFAARVEAFLRAAVHARDYDTSAAAFLVTSVLECQRHPELNAEGSDSLRHTRDFASSAVRDGIDNGELRNDLDVDAASEMLVAALWGLGFYAGFVGGQDRLGAITDEFIRLLDGGPWKRTG
jgi:AcrR family transcriptional regulator